MRRKSFGEMACPIARGLERVGEWWSMLILRDAFAGISRFDDFQQSLGIAPTMLTRRLNALVENGLAGAAALQRAAAAGRVRADRARPGLPTGADQPCWRGATGISRRKARACRSSTAEPAKPAEPVLVDRATGRPLTAPDFTMAAGPAATESTRRRLARGSRASSRFTATEFSHEFAVLAQRLPYGPPRRQPNRRR